MWAVDAAHGCALTPSPQGTGDKPSTAHDPDMVTGPGRLALWSAGLCLFEQLEVWLCSAGKPCCWQQLPLWILLTSFLWLGNSVMVVLGQVPKSELSWCSAVCCAVETEILESLECVMDIGGCVAENILEISTSSLVVPLVNVPWGKSEMHWGPCLWGVGLDLVSIDGMRAAEEKQGDWTHQDKGNTPDEDFGLAEKWPPVSEAVNCLVVGDHLKSQSSVVLLLDRDIPKLSHFAGWKCTRTLNWFTSVDPLVFWSWRMVTLAEVVPAVVGSWEITMVLGRTSSVHGNCAFPWGWFKFGSY